MNILFKKENLKKTILTLGYLVLGVLFCLMPKRMYNFVEFLLCYLLLAAGIICIVIYSLMPSDDKEFKLLVFGVLATAFGFCMILWHKFFGVFLSAIICYSGVCSIVSSLKQKRAKERGWVTEFVIGIIVTVLSITTAIFSGTNVSKNILSIFVGVMLLLNAGFGISGMVVLLKNKKKIPAENVKETTKNNEVKTETAEVSLDAKVADETAEGLQDVKKDS